MLVVDGALRDYNVLARAIRLARVPEGLCGLVVTHQSSLPPGAQDALDCARRRGYETRAAGQVSARELRELYERSLAVLVPVHESSQPAGLTGLLEALSMGCPTVATGNWPIREYLGDNGAALIVPPGDASELAAALETILEDEPMRGRLSHEAVTRAADFSFRRSVDQCRAALLRLVS